METIALHGIVHDRIAELLRWRQWIRRQPNAAFWSPLRVEYETELRCLLRLAREARRRAAAEADRLDPMTQAKATADAAGYGADYWAGDHYVRTDIPNVEGQPEFNGSFR